MTPDSFISGGIAVVFVVAAVTIVLGSYVLAIRLLDPGAESDRTLDAATAVAGRLAALYGLILALVYAQELDDYKGVRSDLVEEAIAVSDIWNDARRCGGPQVEGVQAGLARYLSVVVNEEWRLLAEERRLSARAWTQWEDVYERLLDLSPSSDRQRYLAGRMRDRVAAIARLRQMREAAASGGDSGLFWIPALLGLSLLAVPFYVFRPTRSHLLLLALFGAYSGVVLFFIFAFRSPFEQPGKLEPAPFQDLLKSDIGQSLPK